MNNELNEQSKDKATSRPVLPLKLVYQGVEMADDAWTQYLDIEKMEIVSLPEEPFLGEYDEEDQELSDLIDEGWKTRFFRLPSKFDIHEYSIMERFVYSLDEGNVQNTLENAIRGRGAFRRFKDTLRRFDMEDQWYKYQEEAYMDIAREWCEDNGFEYE